MSLYVTPESGVLSALAAGSLFAQGEYTYKKVTVPSQTPTLGKIFAVNLDTMELVELDEAGVAGVFHTCGGGGNARMDLSISFAGTPPAIITTVGALPAGSLFGTATDYYAKVTNQLHSPPASESWVLDLGASALSSLADSTQVGRVLGRPVEWYPC